MKNRYKTIVRVKKHQLDDAIHRLQLQDKKIEDAKQKEQDIRNILKETGIPQKGNYTDIIKLQHVKKAYGYELNVINEEIFILKRDREVIKKEVTKQNLEYEKVKYLEDEENKKMKSELKRKENSDMDEISIMVFNNNKEENRA